MSIDAVAVLRPRDIARLKPYLDLDEDSEESTGLYAEALPDGTVLVHTFERYASYEANRLHANMWLTQFGEDLPFIHDDPRGILFFPDVIELDCETYAAIVEQVEAGGMWVRQRGLDEAEQSLFIAAQEEDAAETMNAAQGGEGAGDPNDLMSALMGAIDPTQMSKMFEQLAMGAAQGSSGAGSFEFGAMVENLQRQIVQKLGNAGLSPEAKMRTVALLVPRGDAAAFKVHPMVDSVHTLNDGALVVRTSRGLLAPWSADEAQLCVDSLTAELQPALAQDAAGVVAFPMAVDAVPKAASFHAMREVVGAEGHIMKPMSLQEHAAARKAVLRDRLG